MAFDKKAAGIAKAKNTKRILTGDKELDRKLEKLKVAVQNKIVRTAMGKALPIVAKGMKSQVPSQFKGAKKAIGWRNKQSKKKGLHEAKAGAGVGKAYWYGKTTDKKGNARKGATRGKNSSGGVGISGINLLWWILGTASRVRKSFGKGIFAGRESGGNLGTGSMPPQMPNIIKTGAANAWPGALKRMRAEIWAGIQKAVAAK